MALGGMPPLPGALPVHMGQGSQPPMLPLPLPPFQAQQQAGHLRPPGAFPPFNQPPLPQQQQLQQPRQQMPPPPPPPLSHMPQQAQGREYALPPQCGGWPPSAALQGGGSCCGLDAAAMQRQQMPSAAGSMGAGRVGVPMPQAGVALRSGEMGARGGAGPGPSYCSSCDPSGRGDARGKDLAMSPRSRAVYKDFSHTLRSKETQVRGARYAQQLAERCLHDLPEAVHWRVHLEMADLAKREKSFGRARQLYRMATQLQPTAPQAWLEFAKMEEERGHFSRCEKILTLGLRHCPYHEALMLKGIKHLERMGELRAARSLLSQLQYVPVNQSWRTVLEGALLEARAGETAMARRVFKFLLHAAPWYGPVWFEACRFEQRCGHPQEALRVAEEGLKQLPRYGPLWFSVMRLLECALPNRHELVHATRAHVERGVRHISKDLVWKLWFEAAQVEERNGNLARSRSAYVKSVGACAPNLRWKVWLGGARSELSYSRFDVSQALLERALAESPPKTRAIVMLEQSRLYELRGDIEAARGLLRSARKSARSEWKVFLESVLLEMRSEATSRALREARRALEVHRGTGRLWAVLIQLEQASGVHHQLRVFQQALLEVPKSGEVWCEGARICLNPFSDCFNLEAAHNFLDFAIEFTPQYGDSFIEYLRLMMLVGAPDADVERLWQLCINAEPNYGTLWFHSKRTVLLTTRQVLESATELLRRELSEWRSVYDAAIARAARPDFRSTALAAVTAAMLARTGGSADSDAPAAPAPLPPPPLNLPASLPPVEAADFVTGSVALNRMHRQLGRLGLEERRALIYGGDMIVP